MATSDVKAWGTPSRAFPQPVTDLVDRPMRLWHDASLAVTPTLPDLKGSSDEGTYFTVMQTPGFIANGITGNIQTTLVDSTPTLIIVNANGPALPDKRIYLDTVKLLVAVVSGTNTDLQYAWKIDSQPRYTSGGTNLTSGAIVGVGGNVNMDSANNTRAQIYCGVLTVAGASAVARVVDSGQLRCKVAAPVMVIGDEYCFKFGNVDPVSNPGESTTVGTFTIPSPPIILGPNHSAALYIWGTAMATTAPVWWPKVCYIER